MPANRDELLARPDAPTRRLSEEEIARFANGRVLHVTGVLPEKWIRQVEAVVDANTEAVGLQSMQANVWHRDDAMFEIAMNCPTAHLAQQLLGAIATDDDGPTGAEKPIRFFYDQMFVKHPEPAGAPRRSDNEGDLGNTPWHQDITFWPVRGRQIVSIWIALDRTNLDNGALEFVPGSSAFGDRFQAIGVGNDVRLPFASDRLEALPPINSATTGETEADLTAITFELERGDVLVFDANILHGAPANRSDRARRGLALRYIGGDVVLDNDKYGELTVMAPFDVFDPSLANGDAVQGYAYPLVLPRKLPIEVDRRLKGPITPDEKKMTDWHERNRRARKRPEPG